MQYDALLNIAGLSMFRYLFVEPAALSYSVCCIEPLFGCCYENFFENDSQCCSGLAYVYFLLTEAAVDWKAGNTASKVRFSSKGIGWASARSKQVFPVKYRV